MTSTPTGDFDIAVIGSGFAGSLMAMIARQLGHSVVLIERGRHPRFVIGESSTPLANLLLEELARRYRLPRVAALSKWGTWQKAHPGIGCGLKRGFTFYHHHRGEAWKARPDRQNELLVAASPNEATADTHWYRPDFDAFLAREAVELGAEYLDETTLSGAVLSDAGVELTGERAGQPLTLRAGFLIDASGARGFLHRALRLTESSFPALPAIRALYTHFENVQRWEVTHPSTEAPPYPVDDAAMHHVFAGGWIWVLRFNNGITSAGLATTPALAEELQLAEGRPAWERLLARLPSVREQFAAAKVCLPFHYSPTLPFRAGVAAGERWALLPSAAGFVDPLLSTGFALTLLGMERLAGILTDQWKAKSMTASLHNYSRQTLADLDLTAQLVGALYENMGDFEIFAALAHLYFAAAMYAETQRRLEQPGGSFLLQDHALFGPASRSCLARALRCHSSADRQSLLEQIRQTIAPINLAGLGDPARRNWYPCRAEDLRAAAPKLGVGVQAIEKLLSRCGFA